MYREVNLQRVSAIECIAGYYQGSGDGSCPMSYDVPVNAYIDQAKLLPVRFMQKIVAGDTSFLKVER